MRIAIPTAARRELAHRVSGGLEITLYWHADQGSISVEVYHPATDETITLAVAPERALEAFHHPFAHLPRTTDDLAHEVRGGRRSAPAFRDEL